MKITKKELKKIIKEEYENYQNNSISQEARELKLFIDNDGELYRQQFQPILKNLMTKKGQGRYDSEVAVKLFMYLVDNGAKKYDKAHGSGGSEWNLMFPKSVRLEVAKLLRDDFEEEANLGNYDQYSPKKYAKKQEIPMEEQIKEGEDGGDRAYKLGQQFAQKNSFDLFKNERDSKKLVQAANSLGVYDFFDLFKYGALSVWKGNQQEQIQESPLEKKNKFNKDKIKEAISKVLQENEGVLKKLYEEPIEHRYNAEEDYSEDPHKTSFEQLNEEPIEHLTTIDNDNEQKEEDYGSSGRSGTGQLEENEQLQEVAPPGKEKQVKSLKKEFPKGSASPFKIAWSQKNKEKK